MVFWPELKELRNNRWDQALFRKDQANDGGVDESISESVTCSGSGSGSFEFSPLAILKLQDTNRKATIVIDHIIQASDVAHAMQQW
jgi:hypothetical protein